MTRFITDEERDAIEAAQQRLERANAQHARIRSAARAFVFLGVALLAITAAAIAGWIMGGRP